VAEKQTLSYQLRDFSPMAIDQMLYQDMVAAIALTLDQQLINGTGLTGQITGVLNTAGIATVTYTDASPTLAELYPKIMDAQNRVASNRYGVAEVAVMSPRRWFWILASSDTTNKPVVTPFGAENNPAQITGNLAEGVVGVLPTGIKVLIDSNMPTNLGGGANEDAIIITKVSDHLLYQSDPIFETGTGQIASLASELVMYQYANYSAGRYPAATAVIRGTGLATPVF